MSESYRRMNKIIHSGTFCFLIILCIGLFNSGCDNPDFQGKHYDIKSYSDFVKALKDMRYTVKEDKEKQDTHSESLFSVSPRELNLDGEIVSVYEFENSETAESEADTISWDGYTIDGKRVDWDAVPHFFQKGNLIVSYIGSEDTKLYFDLTAILGHSITD